MAASEISADISPTRILVVDDSQAMRRGLRHLLERHPHWRLCGEASDGREAVEVSMHMSPQLADEARKAGIRGVCAKSDVFCVVEAVETLLNNGTYFRA